MSAVRETIDASRVGQSVRLPQQEQQHSVDRSKRAQAKPSRIWQRVSLAACCAISFAAVWIVAGQGAKVYKLNDENTQLQTKLQHQSAVNATLNAQVEEMKRPSRILKVAINELHMQYKSPVTISAQGK